MKKVEVVFILSESDQVYEKARAIGEICIVVIQKIYLDELLGVNYQIKSTVEETKT